MKSLALCLALIPAVTLSAQAAETPAVTSEAFEPILGTDWTGSLTYMNYQAPFQDVTIPAALDVTAVEGGFEFAYKYPDEPHANSTSLVTIGEDGLTLADQTVIANRALADGTQTIITTSACEDMGKPATCEMVYSLSPSQMVMTKMVTYDGETEAFRRNEYTFVR